MNEQPEPPPDFVRQQIEAIVADGQDIRVRVAQLVSGTAAKFNLNREGLLGLARSVMDGTAAAVDRAVPQDPDSVLRLVVDGLGDGLSTAALATRLAMEEAAARRQTFADEDLAKMNQHLRSLGSQFVDTVTETAKQFGSMTVTQLGSVRDHAAATMKRMQPSLESALTAAGKHPLQLGKESVAAGLSLSRQALGALFGAVGRSMQEAGKLIAGEGAGKKSSDAGDTHHP